jgi:hypothetical protein
MQKKWGNVNTMERGDSYKYTNRTKKVFKILQRNCHVNTIEQGQTVHSLAVFEAIFTLIFFGRMVNWF